MNSVSPLRYPGGKACLYEFVRQIIALNNLRLAQYCEPFAGGCGLALSLLYSGEVSQIHINDIDLSIWAFWHSVLNETENFVRLIEETQITLGERDRQRAIHERGEISNSLELGFSAFFLNRTSHSGIIRGSGAIGGLSQSGIYKVDCRFNKVELIRRVRRIALYRESIHLTRLDALEFMSQKGQLLPPKTLFCIDPPYFEKGAKLYTNSFSLDDHQRMSVAIQRLRQPYLVTYDNSPVIANLFAKRRRYLLQLPYSLQTKRVGTELVVASDKLKLEKWAPESSKVKLFDYAPT